VKVKRALFGEVLVNCAPTKELDCDICTFRPISVMRLSERANYCLIIKARFVKSFHFRT
jgi:hypothetical protein